MIRPTRKTFIIAKVKVGNDHITLEWLGLYNRRTGERVFLENPFSTNSQNNSIKLKLCM